MTPKDITGTFTDEQYDEKDIADKWKVELYDDSYNLLRSYTFGCWDDSGISGKIDAGHDCYLVVSSYDADAAVSIHQFSFHLGLDPFYDIDVNETYTKKLEYKGQKNHFVFELPSAGSLQFEVTPGENASNVNNKYWQMELVMPDGNSWGKTYIKGGKKTSTITTGFAAGKYEIVISQGLTFTDENYSIIVNYDKRDDWETERNESRGQATLMTTDKDYYGHLGDIAGDNLIEKDYYKFTAPRDGSYTITFSHTYDGKDGFECYRWYVDLIGGDGFTMKQMKVPYEKERFLL